MIKGNEAWHCPSIDPAGPTVDPTGCGNCSTGAAAYALSSGFDLRESLVMANVAAGFNAAQYGPIPNMDASVRALALASVKDSMGLAKKI